MCAIVDLTIPNLIKSEPYITNSCGERLFKCSLCRQKNYGYLEIGIPYA